ncbi:MAG: bifunctional salicylyl-CoA 5-hydroxylase/oxidoreductase [Alphaproteobacteria bacterium]|jgi:anthraniloyl-CoA monooxygenase|nr:bifunctional salicylyl-CoA 5-hydroxylase/oxidoreductase [Alphaproteobacteria bacterium]MDP6565541.1 bifunctional salicylyl-CoA 5-hydroxylase/oxidoreductase [Alphaproteobacteria bacterium]MDP6812080.1 bifunctional salicylyl-CoA 5-hydroxylase/oxidoreductase [Alphaproteobacteria bacterium]
MKANVIGGGPAGLYFAILAKRRHPGDDITVYERNRPDDTFGFGVVFSDETLGHFRDADSESYDEIVANFAYWDEIETHYGGSVIRSAGHGFCGMSRVKLLNILQRRAQALGVRIEYQTEITDLEAYRDADLVVAADGVNSLIRETHAASFKPHIDHRPNRFVWLGTNAPLAAFTFIFKGNRHGIWNVHAYRYEEGRATWIVETTERTWLAAGMDQASEADTVAYMAELFGDELAGAEILNNRSNWRAFPNIQCESWVHENVVLLGDAAHTAHFSIGSGTKLAMEDAIALCQAREQEGDDVAAALAAYDEIRRDEVERIQHAADTSLSWFENVDRYFGMHPVQFNFSMLTRSKQITYDNLALRDPALVDQVRDWFAGEVAKRGLPVPTAPPPPPMFTPFQLRRMVLANRVVVSPMCQYSAEDGLPNDWHLVHLGGRALGGAGLVVTEMTAIDRLARISPGCAGIYTDDHCQAWRRIVDFVHANSAAKICLQLGHAGRKGSTQLGWQQMDHRLPRDNWPTMAASPIPYLEDGPAPRQMTETDMDQVVECYVRATAHAVAAGFDMIELHMAHGYLLAGFISPLTNRRTDGYGGPIENRMRFPGRVFDAVRAAWPEERPVSVRISATDWTAGGLSEADAVAVALMLKERGCDLIDVSAGQTVADQAPDYGRMFQVPFSDRIRQEAAIPTVAVGNITTADQVNTIVAAGRADLVALARPHLANPHFTLAAAAQYDYPEQPWPPQYLNAREQAHALAARQQEEMAELRYLARPAKPGQQDDG